MIQMAEDDLVACVTKTGVEGIVGNRSGAQVLCPLILLCLNLKCLRSFLQFEIDFLFIVYFMLIGFTTILFSN